MVSKKKAAPIATSVRLAKLGLTREIDFVLHLPMRYEDETEITAVASAEPGQTVQIEVLVRDCQVMFRPRRQLVVRVADESGEVVLRFLNFYQSQVKQFEIGRRLRIRGELRGGFLGLEMVHPRYQIVHEDTPLPMALTPVYPAGEGVSQTVLRTAIDRALASADLSEGLPPEIREQYKLAEFAASVERLHHPPPDASQEALALRTDPAWIRIKFDELLAQQISLRSAQLARRERVAPRLTKSKGLQDALIAMLPFELTRAQRRVWKEISRDLGEPYPMQRLLQGDVGSGKTIVAALAALRAIDNGYQAALMAPTEILAEQHFRKLSLWIEALGVRVAWLTGSLKKKQKELALSELESGVARLAVGTHALFQDAVTFERLGLTIVDEQHRFGVGQRLALRAKSGAGQPHQLMMSATPIPRTLAMTYYADLEVSTIDELPPGRTPVATKLVTDGRRAEVVARVASSVREGQQVYWVCPLIEESETLQLKTAVETHAALAAELVDMTVGLIHGRLSTAQKAETMKAFVERRIDVLVSTTVIEVGVDVPNASLMVIEHAERFGLSQLHQLRGRVGRGVAHSTCVLLYQTPLSQTAKERLRIMRETSDGFEIARRDLDLRGPGEFLGQRQSGMALLRFADLQNDQALVQMARDAAAMMLREHPLMARAHMERWLGGREEFLKA